MTVGECKEDLKPVQEAEENLRIIRDLMERSTRHSTFSGLSGVLAGLISIGGCLIQHYYVASLPSVSRTAAFLINWAAIVALAIGIDFLLTKRRAALVGKTILSRLGRQMAIASAPGLGMGAVFTLYFLQQGMMDAIYPLWMLAYGCAVSAVGLFSQKDVTRLGWAFLGIGALTLLGQALIRSYFPAFSFGLFMTAISFGGFHIVYGVKAGCRGGW